MATIVYFSANDFSRGLRRQTSVQRIIQPFIQRFGDHVLTWIGKTNQFPVSGHRSPASNLISIHDSRFTSRSNPRVIMRSKCVFRWFAFVVNLFFLAIFSVPAIADESDSQRPNILWITIEDWSTDLSCYGTKGIQTPFIDKLASQGVL